jgi:(p)ppGpp synthase/HD superfamily hydrolase
MASVAHEYRTDRLGVTEHDSANETMPYVRLDRAIQLAANLHSGQYRDGSNPLPYVTHPMEVVSHLRHRGEVTDEDLLVAAALHDVVEEADYSLSKIADEFGDRVADLVNELTRTEPSKTEVEGMSKEEIWQLRAAMLEDIGRMSRDAQQIKLADRLANLYDSKRTKLGDKLTRYYGQTYLMLHTVRREVNPQLWDAIKAALPDQ